MGHLGLPTAVSQGEVMQMKIDGRVVGVTATGVRAVLKGEGFKDDFADTVLEIVGMEEWRGCTPPCFRSALEHVAGDDDGVDDVIAGIVAIEAPPSPPPPPPPIGQGDYAPVAPPPRFCPSSPKTLPPPDFQPEVVKDAPLTLEELKRVVKEADEIARPYYGKALLALLGATGSGKTVTWHALQGHPLTISVDGERIELVDKKHQEMNAIGNGGGSETLKAVGESADFMREEVFLLDLPGDLDTRRAGYRTLLKNALIKTLVMRNASSVRCVLLMQFGQLTTNHGAQLDEGLEGLLERLVDLPRHLDSISTFVCPVSAHEQLYPWDNRNDLDLIMKVLRPLEGIDFAQRSKTCRTLMGHVKEHLQNAEAFRRDTLGHQPKAVMPSDLRAYAILPVSKDREHLRRIIDIIKNTPPVSDPSSAFRNVLPHMLESMILQELTGCYPQVVRLLEGNERGDLVKAEQIIAELIGLCDTLRVVEMTNRSTREAVEGCGGVKEVLHEEWNRVADKLVKAVKNATGNKSNSEADVTMFFHRLTQLHECVLAPLGSKTLGKPSVWTAPKRGLEDVKARCEEELRKNLDGIAIAPGADADAVALRFGICKRVEQVLGLQERSAEGFCERLVRSTAEFLKKLELRPDDADAMHSAAAIAMHMHSVFRALETVYLFAQLFRGENPNVADDLAANHADTQRRLFDDLQVLQKQVLHLLVSMQGGLDEAADTAKSLKLLRLYAEEPQTAKALGKDPDELKKLIISAKEIDREAEEEFGDVSSDAQRLAQQFLRYDVLSHGGDANMAEEARAKRSAVRKEICSSVLPELKKSLIGGLTMHIEDVRKRVADRSAVGAGGRLKRQTENHESEQSGMEKMTGVLCDIVHLLNVDGKLSGDRRCSQLLSQSLGVLRRHLDLLSTISYTAGWPLSDPDVLLCSPSAQNMCETLRSVNDVSTPATPQASREQLLSTLKHAEEMRERVLENINLFLNSSAFPSQCVGADWPQQFRDAFEVIDALPPDAVRGKREQLTKAEEEYISGLSMRAEDCKSIADRVSLVWAEVRMLNGSEKAKKCVQELIRDMDRRVKEQRLNVFTGDEDLDMLSAELESILDACQREGQALDLTSLSSLFGAVHEKIGTGDKAYEAFKVKLHTDRDSFANCIMDCVRDFLPPVLPKMRPLAWKLLSNRVFTAIRKFSVMLESDVPAAALLGKQLMLLFQQELVNHGSEGSDGGAEVQAVIAEWRKVTDIVHARLGKVDDVVKDWATDAFQAQTAVSEHLELAEVFQSEQIRDALKMRWETSEPGSDPVAVRDMASFYFEECQGGWCTSKFANVKNDWSKFERFVLVCVSTFLNGKHDELKRSLGNGNYRRRADVVDDAQQVLKVLEHGAAAHPNNILAPLLKPQRIELSDQKLLEDEKRKVNNLIEVCNAKHDDWDLNAQITWLASALRFAELSCVGIGAVSNAAAMIFHELSSSYRSGDQVTKLACVSSACASVSTISKIVSTNEDCGSAFSPLKRQVDDFVGQHKGECDATMGTYLARLEEDLSVDKMKLTDDVFKLISVLRSYPSVAEKVDELLKAFDDNLAQVLKHARDSIAKAAIDQVDLEKQTSLYANLRSKSSDQLKLLEREKYETGVGQPDYLRMIRAAFLRGLNRMVEKERKTIDQEPAEVVRFYVLQKRYFSQLRDLVEALPEEPLPVHVLEAHLKDQVQTVKVKWQEMQSEGSLEIDGAMEFKCALSRLKTFSNELKRNCRGDLAAEHLFAMNAEREAICGVEEWMDGTAQRLGACDNAHDVTDGLVLMRRVALLAPTLHLAVKKQIGRALVEVDSRWSREKMEGLRSKLLHHQDKGAAMQITAEHPRHLPDPHQNLFSSRAKGGKTIDEVLGDPAFECLPPLSRSEHTLLKGLLMDHDKYYSERLDEAMGKRFRTSRDALLRELNTLAAEAKRSQTAASFARLVSCICVCFSLFSAVGDTAGDGEAETGPVRVRPHIVQVMTIYRMLGVEMGNSFSQWIVNKASVLGVNTGDKRRRNHMAQIKTGAGKSITLCIAAATFALQGVGADIVCYSEYLTKRDEEKMRRFLSFLEIGEEMVRYFTFESLCKSQMEGVGEVAKKLIEKGIVDVAEVKKIQQPSNNRVLFIDEVDVFFTRRFCGNTYNAGFSLRSPKITAFVRKVFARCRGKETFDPLKLDEFQEVLKDYSDSVRPMLMAVARQVVKGASAFAERRHRLNRQKCVIEYRRGDQYEPVVYPNESMFCYLVFADELTDEVIDSKLGLDCPFCFFSYAEIPTRYMAVLGVSGTLSCMSEAENNFLETKYDVKCRTFLPSVFGTPTLNGGVQTLSHDTFTNFHKTEGDWIKAIERRALSTSDRAVLVFCKNQAQVDLLRKKSGMLNRCDALTEETPPDERAGIIAASVQKGRVTLCTRAYGRGVDFLALDESTIVLCIATFLPSTLSEQVQIIGRTGRQGQQGEFRMELCNEHLMRKFFPDVCSTAPDEAAALAAVQEIIDTMQAAPPEQMRKSAELDRRQRIKSDSKSKDRETRMRSADGMDKRSGELMKLLGGSEDANKKTEAVVKSVLSFFTRPTMCCVLLDASYSMKDDWPSLKSSYQAFLAELSPETRENTFVIVFADSARQVPTDCLPDKHEDTRVGNLTNYGAAFTLLIQLMSDDKYASFAKSILFFTDGWPTTAGHTAVCEDLLTKHGDDIQSFFTIYFNKNTSPPPAVTELERQFSRRQVHTELQTPQKGVELTQCMKQAAHTGGQMHSHA